MCSFISFFFFIAIKYLNCGVKMLGFDQVKIFNQNHIYWHRVDLIFCRFVVKILSKVEKNATVIKEVK